ncbi:MAG: FecR domain-containing protein [Chitinivibrionales bacterium]|nr:FecR domain-containing protein [Chitinivibrionales bacterium]
MMNKKPHECKETQDATVDKLSELLRRVAVIPQKQEHEWQILENSIIEQLAIPGSTKRSVLPRLSDFTVKNLFTPSYVTPLVALILITTLALFFFHDTVQRHKNFSTTAIMAIQGTVSITDQNGTLHSLNHGSFHFQEKSTFQTTKGATAIVQIDSGSYIILSENSTLQIEDASQSTIELNLQRGEIVSTVSKRLKNQKFSVTTPNSICTIVGTIFDVSVTNPSNHSVLTKLAVLEGTVAIANRSKHNETILVNAGQSICAQDSVIQPVQTMNDPTSTQYLLELLQCGSELFGQPDTSLGLVSVLSTPPNAQVRINDSLIGITPLVTLLHAGKYALTVQHRSAYLPWQQTITVGSSTPVFFDATLSSSIAVPNEQETKKVSRQSLKKKVRTLQQVPLTVETTETGHASAPASLGTKDFGFIQNPAFVEALVQMTIGEYQKALAIFDSLKELPQISITEKIRIMGKIAACYKGIGNFTVTLQNLNSRYATAASPTEKSNLLWEIINVKANCLEDYEGAEADILTYIKNYPRGSWIEPAYLKLGEIQYICGKYAKALGTFHYHLNLFKTSKLRARSLYTLANIMRLDIRDYTMALKWYDQLLTQFPTSGYFGNALFERAQCFEKMGQPEKALQDYQTYLRKFPNGTLKNLCLNKLSNY